MKLIAKLSASAVVLALMGILATGWGGPAFAQSASARCDRLAAHPRDPEKRGRGVAFEQLARQTDAAIAACSAAASQGDLRSRYQLGRAYDARRDYRAAIREYQAAAERGYGQAMVGLGLINPNDLTHEQRQARQLDLFQRAAAKGNPQAHEYLAKLHRQGAGTPYDPERATEHELTAMGGATPKNRLALAERTWNSASLRKVRMAEIALRPIADRGSPRVAALYGLALDRLAQDPSVFDRSIRYHQRGAKGGDADGQNGLGYAYEYGRGIEVDAQKAAFWYKKAIAQGHQHAARNYARLTGQGYGGGGSATDGFDRNQRDIMNSHMCAVRGLC